VDRGSGEEVEQPLRDAGLYPMKDHQMFKKTTDKRTVIMDAALSTFVKRGYSETKVAEIASEAGVAEGTLYNYFQSKEDLLLALFDEKWGGIIDEIKKKISRLDDPNKKLKAVFSSVVMMFKKNRHLAELFMVDVKQSSIFLTNYTINRIVQFLDLIEGILEEGKRKGMYRKDLDSRVAKMVIFGAAQGILLSWVLSESQAVRNKTFKFSLYRAAKTLKDIFKSGLVGEKA
jgi:TetR/AcrR family fatty acid metabolism transcriptional regulator